MKALLIACLLLLTACALDFRAATAHRNNYYRVGIRHEEYNLDSFSRINIVVMGDSADIRVTHVRFGVIMTARVDTARLRVWDRVP